MSSKRGCCVYNCFNNSYKINRWRNEICDTHNIKHSECNCRVPYIMLTFPTKNLDLRNEWIKRVNHKNWQPNYDSRICSEHFVDVDYTNKKTLTQYPCPTLKMGYQLIGDRSKRKRRPPSTTCAIVKKKSKEKQSESSGKNESTETENGKAISKEQVECSDMETLPNTQCNTTQRTCQECLEYKNKVNRLQGEVSYWQGQYFRKQQKPFSLDILKDDAKVKSYTGLPSKQVFDSLFCSFGGKVKKINKWHGPTLYKSSLNRNKFSQRRKSTQPFLRPKEEYFMALFRIKTMLKNQIIGELFGVSSAVVSRTCLTWWKFMAKELKALVYNPEEEVHRALLPPTFNIPHYKNVQHIIYCTEVFVETPKNKKAQASLWSNYKHHYTCKYLVSITPYGLINFVSKGYGGRMSDRQIVEDSGFLNEVRRGEQVMADKGFHIADLLTLKYADLVIPPGRCGAFQMPKKDVVKTKEIANRCIRVEQVIRRIKSFNMLKYEVPITLIHSLDDIVIICCALCNLMGPFK